MEINQTMQDAIPTINWQNCDARLKKSRLQIHQILQIALQDYERQQFNTVVSSCMKLLNELSAYEITTTEDEYLIYTGLSFLLRLLAPITPHICHILWQQLGFEKAIIDAAWPKVDKNALKSEDIDYVVQINGKLRAEFTAKVNTPEEELIALAKQHAASFLEGKSVNKFIIVAHRNLINLVVSP